MFAFRMPVGASRTFLTGTGWPSWLRLRHAPQKPEDLRARSGVEL
jgi:hypothetical protein